MLATGEAIVALKDDLANALEIREAANSVMKVVTTNAAEQVVWGYRHAAGAATNTIADPGNGAAIPVNQGSGYVPIVTAGAETNTLAIPLFTGQKLVLCMDTRVGGDRVVTSAQRVNQAGNTILTFGAAGDVVEIYAVTIAGALRWQVGFNDGVALS